MTAQDRQLNVRTFLAWKMKFFKFMTFQFSMTCQNTVCLGAETSDFF